MFHASKSEAATPKLSFLEKNLLGVSVGEAPSLLPGVACTAAIAWLSVRISDYIGTAVLGFEKSPVSSVMMAILLGLIIGNLIRLPSVLRSGVTFSVKKLLRLGIIFLGIRLSIADVFRLGSLGIPIVLTCVIGALFITTRLNRWLRLPDRLGSLIAVGTSICGVSAIVATGAVIDAEEEESAYAVAVITIFGLLATLLYPFVANVIFAGDPLKAGFFLGTSVHDTSQVTGSALVFSELFGTPRALEVATVTKLVRNVFMVAVIPFMAFYYGHLRSQQGQKPTTATSPLRLFPLFVLGFLAFAVLRSVGDSVAGTGGAFLGFLDEDAWRLLTGAVANWSVSLMVVALAGVGLSTNFGTLRGLGVKPFLVGLGAAVSVGALSFVTISFLGQLINP